MTRRSERELMAFSTRDEFMNSTLTVRCHKKFPGTSDRTKMKVIYEAHETSSVAARIRLGSLSGRKRHDRTALH